MGLLPCYKITFPYKHVRTQFCQLATPLSVLSPSLSPFPFPSHKAIRLFRFLGQFVFLGSHMPHGLRCTHRFFIVHKKYLTHAFTGAMIANPPARPTERIGWDITRTQLLARIFQFVHFIRFPRATPGESFLFAILLVRD